MGIPLITDVVTRIVNVQWGEKSFVALGTKITSSSDGIEWVEHEDPTGDASYEGLAFGVDTWIMSARDDTIYVSEDGMETWENRTIKPEGINGSFGPVMFIDPPLDLNEPDGDRKFENGLFVIDDEGDTMIYSLDLGETWARTPELDENIADSATYRAGDFLFRGTDRDNSGPAFGTSPTCDIYWSVDAVNWTKVENIFDGGVPWGTMSAGGGAGQVFESITLAAVAYDPDEGTYQAIGSFTSNGFNGSRGFCAASSANGMTWGNAATVAAPTGETHQLITSPTPTFQTFRVSVQNYLTRSVSPHGGAGGVEVFVWPYQKSVDPWQVAEVFRVPPLTPGFQRETIVHYGLAFELGVATSPNPVTFALQEFEPAYDPIVHTPEALVFEDNGVTITPTVTQTAKHSISSFSLVYNEDEEVFVMGGALTNAEPNPDTHTLLLYRSEDGTEWEQVIDVDAANQNRIFHITLGEVSEPPPEEN